jgi:predicted NAD-dependent protein-ADP-ribosyltransferase YbiA (DUF1768 family)
VKSAQLINVYKNGELDLQRLSRPLLYSFSKPDYLAKLDANPKLIATVVAETQVQTEMPAGPEPLLEKEMRADAHLQLNVGKTNISKTHREAKEILDTGVFEPIEGFTQLDPLVEETAEIAEKERAEYKESSRDNWMQKYMRNSNYRIHEVEANGDCFFATVRDAFASIGRKTTVEKLRAILAREMTDEVFSEYRTLYLSFVDEIQEMKRDKVEVERSLKEYKKAIANITDKTAADAKQIIAKSKELETNRKALNQKIAETEELMRVYTGPIQGIDTLEKMRNYVRTSSFWADTWAITTIERVLNIKMILFSEQAFATDDGAPDLDGVLLCNEASKELQERQTFSPDYYIMVSYSGNHYRLISYQSHKILQFRDIPYDVKMLILNRCISKLSGVYYLIQDFRNLKTKYGIDEDEGAPLDYRETEGYGDLYGTDAIFVFCSNSDPKVKPGEGSGEKILATNKAKYAKLHSKFNSWRKKLDDDWDKTPIIIDTHKWTSITHYMQAVQYKKTHPDVYMMFSLSSDPDSTLARSVKTAKSFKGIVKEVEPETESVIEGKKKPRAPKKKTQVIAPDLDFDDKRREEERMKALTAKFHDNETMRLLLNSTGDALLIHKCGPGEPAEPDMQLMRVRKSIQQ